MHRSFNALKLLTACSLAACIGIIGCGEKPVKLVPVQGTLKLNGKGAPNVTLQFLPDVVKGNKGPTSYATTDAQGNFSLKTHDGRDGAVEGPHQIVLVDNEVDRPAQGEREAKPPRFDSKYTIAGRGLSTDVKAGTPVSLEVITTAK